MRSDRPLLLHGPSGVGKSTLGPLVAARVARPFVDLDREVERALGASVQSVFEQRGEGVFRAAERSALEAVLDRTDAPIVALGGGALVDPASREAALDRATVCTLVAPPDVLGARLAGSGDRPLVGAEDATRVERIARLLGARREVYAVGAVRLDVATRPMSEVVDRLVAATHDTFSRVGASAFVRMTDAAGPAVADAIDGLRPSRVLIVTDDVVRDLHVEPIVKLVDDMARGPERRSAVLVIPSGEASKRLSMVEHLAEQFATVGADRNAVVIGIGGGVVTDVAGFAASVFMRGVRWIAVPTTTLGMVDAAIGGKTAVDLGVRKNLVGAFHMPTSTIIDPSLARTESPRARRSGFAEVIKSLALGDAVGFERLEAASSADDNTTWREAIARGAAVKARIVRADPTEQAERVTLNFGHTFGHAIEAQGGLDRWTHGEAVAIGMVLAARVGELVGVTPPEVVSRLERCIRRVGLPTEVAASDLRAAAAFVSSDKKREGQAIRFVLLEELGRPVVRRIPFDELETLLRRLVR